MYQLAIEDVEFQMMVLDDGVLCNYDVGCAVVFFIWFSVALSALNCKRYLYLV